MHESTEKLLPWQQSALDRFMGGESVDVIGGVACGKTTLLLAALSWLLRAKGRNVRATFSRRLKRMLSDEISAISTIPWLTEQTSASTLWIKHDAIIDRTGRMAAQLVWSETLPEEVRFTLGSNTVSITARRARGSLYVPKTSDNTHLGDYVDRARKHHGKDVTVFDPLGAMTAAQGGES